MAVIWRKHLPSRKVPRTPPAQSALQCVEAVATSTIRHGRLFQRQNQRQNVGGGRFEKALQEGRWRSTKDRREVRTLLTSLQRRRLPQYQAIP
jgi:hypothetical protein